MNRADVIARLQAAEPELRARGVAALYLYGSYARDEARVDSDLDVLIDYASTVDYSLSSYMAPYLYLEELFPGTEIGYSTREGLSKYVIPYVAQDAIRIFGEVDESFFRRGEAPAPQLHAE